MSNKGEKKRPHVMNQHLNCTEEEKEKRKGLCNCTVLINNRLYVYE